MKPDVKALIVIIIENNYKYCYFRVQQAFCLQQMGKEKEAAGIYQNVLKDKPSDQALVAIASNNLVVINRWVTLCILWKRRCAYP